MANGYQLYLKHKQLVRKREKKLLKLYSEAEKIDREKAKKILNRLGDPYDPLTYCEAVRELKKIIDTQRRKQLRKVKKS